MAYQSEAALEQQFIEQLNKQEYRSVMKQIKLKPEDHLYILGDVVDRFPDGLGILRETMKAPNITLLLGNHEYTHSYPQRTRKVAHTSEVCFGGQSACHR